MYITGSSYWVKSYFEVGSNLVLPKGTPVPQFHSANTPKRGYIRQQLKKTNLENIPQTQKPIQMAIKNLSLYPTMVYLFYPFPSTLTCAETIDVGGQKPLE